MHSAPDPGGRRLLTASEVAAILGVSRKWVYRKCEAGVLPHIRLSSSLLRFDPRLIEEWLQNSQ
jgi:excisionase family DNA binding protein